MCEERRCVERRGSGERWEMGVERDGVRWRNPGTTGGRERWWGLAVWWRFEGAAKEVQLGGKPCGGLGSGYVCGYAVGREKDERDVSVDESECEGEREKVVDEVEMVDGEDDFVGWGAG